MTDDRTDDRPGALAAGGPDPADSLVIDRAGLDQLIGGLLAAGYRVIGPTVRDSAIVLAELSSGAELPAGWGVDSAPGRYRLRRRSDAAVFGHSAGPQSWKRLLHPPRRILWSADSAPDGWSADGSSDGRTEPEEDPRWALLGVRGCDLAAIRTLDTVLGNGAHPDTSYRNRRRRMFVIAVNCTEPGGVCFCASMGTGPAVGPGYDLALTERITAAGHWFVVDIGTPEGRQMLDGLPRMAVDSAEVARARAAVVDAADRMGRAMPEVDLRDLLRESRESPHWQEVAQRCLTCGNCTMVCPTCFCTTVEDVTDLTGGHAQRVQRWASCFEPDFSYLHGGPVQASAASRYRQWMSHKLSTWYDQFGTSGCVGCGRCIAWCPVGIDITEEAARLADGWTPERTAPEQERSSHVDG